MQKPRNVQHSITNDVSLDGYTTLMISEPYILEIDRKANASPVDHKGWTAILLSERHDGRWALRDKL